MIAGGMFFVVSRGLDYLDDWFGPPEDYNGKGAGSVTVEVHAGDSLTTIGATLEQADIVASEEAFTDAASDNPDSQSIQPGFYEMRRKMSGESALRLLLSGNNRVETQLTVPEGLTAEQIARLIGAKTDIKTADVRKVLDRPQSLGLPSYANGDPEGYLFPATYPIRPDSTARTVVRSMVGKFREVTDQLDLEAAARRAGMTPHDVVTVASLVQAEASRPEDLGKVARVIDNRAKAGDLLQLDSTVHYAVDGTTNGVFTTDEQRAVDDPYNTYRYPGLPPGAIGSPGESALRAALNPTPGDWTFFVTINLETGETLFATTLDQHEANRQKLLAYCESSDLC